MNYLKLKLQCHFPYCIAYISPDNMNAFLSSLYYDPKHPASFGTVEKLYKASREAGKSYTKSQIEKWAHGQDTFTMFKPVRQNFPTRKTIAYGLFDLHEADLLDVTSHSKFNGGVKFILLVIDVFSKVVSLEPLKDKSSVSMVKAFTHVYGAKGLTTPIHLATDRGLEFLSRPIQKLFKKLKIHHYTLQGKSKAAVSERAIKTFKSRLYKFMDSTGSQRFVNKLPHFVRSYNNTVHRSIGMKPIDVTIENTAEVEQKLYGKHRKKSRNPPKFTKGEMVRISKHKMIFEKGYSQTFTTESFVIDRVLKTDPPTYKLKDYYNEPITGSFYEQELVRVYEDKDKRYRIDYVLKEQGRGKRKRYLVKYRGYSRPEWTSSLPKNINTTL